VAIVLVAVTLAALVAIPAAIAAFAAQAQNEGNTITAAPDFTPPAITAVALGKTEGGVTGFVRQGGKFFVYANVAADAGNPPSGIATVKANVGEFGAGTTVTLTAGTFTAGGVSYNYRSAEVTDTLQTGTKSFTVTATDAAGNARTVEGSATADSAPPTAVDIQSANGGTTPGFAEENDSLTYTFSESMEPQSILAGWTGATTNVTVRVYNNGLLGLGGNDLVQIYNSTNATILPLGTIDLGRNDYAAGLLEGSYRFLESKMTMTGNTITIVFGTYSSTVLVDPGRGNAAGTGQMTWTPVATPYDRAGNVMSTTPALESGPADKEF
jgi:hypothetical protein